MVDPIPDTPPEGEEARAIWSIRRMVKATTGKDLSQTEAESLFSETKRRLLDAMAQAKVEQP